MNWIMCLRPQEAWAVPPTLGSFTAVKLPWQGHFENAPWNISLIECANVVYRRKGSRTGIPPSLPGPPVWLCVQNPACPLVALVVITVPGILDWAVQSYFVRMCLHQLFGSTNCSSTRLLHRSSGLQTHQQQRGIMVGFRRSFHFRLG